MHVFYLYSKALFPPFTPLLCFKPLSCRREALLRTFVCQSHWGKVSCGPLLCQWLWWRVRSCRWTLREVSSLFASDWESRHTKARYWCFSSPALPSSSSSSTVFVTLNSSAPLRSFLCSLFLLRLSLNLLKKKKDGDNLTLPLFSSLSLCKCLLQNNKSVSLKLDIIYFKYYHVYCVQSDSWLIQQCYNLCGSTNVRPWCPYGWITRMCHEMAEL